ncbi:MULTISPECIES: hypothetical protein [Myxococcus]|nr:MULTISPECIES: hypothetical protein [Myxococcus]NOJ53607.1 hypothetical protein [Myxococcus xanthus]QPM80471.1 hypothetical protein I5Q59_04015 [Myxococcus xanthus]QVW69533.1 hypothetical protein JTM82_08305 [Myxococcus xanthus DZ2]QZZ48333.1 hypothetical protein MyxoNM_03925 [Myxococcus xanthus]UEO04340.1 hypothetical protein K1515_34505 [Myxococcus xanthus DZ2]
MEILGATILGVVIFSVLIMGVILGGAMGHKQERNLREITERQQAAGITGDVTMNDNAFACPPDQTAHA